MRIFCRLRIRPPNEETLRDLGRALGRGQTRIQGETGEAVLIPAALADLLRDVVKKLQEGRSVVVLPEDRHLTTQQAGELLGMSRPYVIRLLDEGVMPYVLVGKHRRIALRDVLAYGQRRAKERRGALDRMAREAYEAGQYDDESAGIPEGGRDE